MPDAITDALSLQVLHSSPTFARPRGSGFHRLSQTVRVTGAFPPQARFVVAPPCCGYCRPTRCHVGHGLGRRGWFPPPAPFVAAPALLEARGFSGSAAGGACCVGDLALFVQVASPDKTRRYVACVSRLATWFCDSSCLECSDFSSVARVSLCEISQNREVVEPLFIALNVCVFLNRVRRTNTPIKQMRLLYEVE